MPLQAGWDLMEEKTPRVISAEVFHFSSCDRKDANLTEVSLPAPLGPGVF